MRATTVKAKNLWAREKTGKVEGRREKGRGKTERENVARGKTDELFSLLVLKFL